MGLALVVEERTVLDLIAQADGTREQADGDWHSMVLAHGRLVHQEEDDRPGRKLVNQKSRSWEKLRRSRWML